VSARVTSTHQRREVDEDMGVARFPIENV